MTQWYETDLLTHYRSSAFKGTLPNPSWTSDSCNPSCGDSVKFSGIVNDHKLEKIMFDGAGCVISQAAASLLAEKVVGAPLTELSHLTVDEVLSLVKIPLGPTRARCALLAFEALTAGLAHYHNTH